MAAENGVDLTVTVGDTLAKQLALAAGVPNIAMVGDKTRRTARLVCRPATSGGIP
ncbi:MULTISPECIES: hypothetical protein [Streptomyces]|uniref:hypothetical protein n=1 Tax=Streptomyces TaxID=1883 RepID=UPI002E30CFA8|nr:hypothetical protein [Streptomyces sp. NBC_01478]WSX55503.1 hypothetical protein OG504_03275 [Streptomyces sp. NBC_00986]